MYLIYLIFKKQKMGIFDSKIRIISTNTHTHTYIHTHIHTHIHTYIKKKEEEEEER